MTAAKQASLAELCRSLTRLPEKDIAQLDQLAGSIGYMADLTGSDMFIDCMDKTGQTAVVVAQAKPNNGASNYLCTVLGQTALQENEPAVYRAFSTQMPVRDIKAVTQESRTVKQDVVPVQNDAGQVIGVLIRETDISIAVQKEKKYRLLAREREDFNDTLLSLRLNPAQDESSAAMREIHHRVKNNLQMVASILNIQSRRAPTPQTRRIFEENTSRVLSIAAIHDILTNTDSGDEVALKPLIDKIRRNIQSICGERKPVTITVTGSDLVVDSSQATSIALVVNELITNCLDSAFTGRESGQITIFLQEGSRYHTITVEDDGVGFDPANRSGNGLGLDIVSLTVRDKLGGSVRIQSGSGGTKVLFDFKVLT